MDTIKLGHPLVILRGIRLEFPNNDIFPSLKIVSISAKSVEPDQIPQKVTFIWIFAICLVVSQFNFLSCLCVSSITPPPSPKWVL